MRCPSCSELITVPLLLAVVESPEEKLTDPDAFVLSVLNPEPDGSDTRKCQCCSHSSDRLEVAYLTTCLLVRSAALDP